jgi:hypothetical protein
MREIALHLLDLAENSVSANAQKIIINICEDYRADLLTASIEDNGKGMSPELVKNVTDPFVTSRTTRKVGLGIPLLKEAAEACNGGMVITSALEAGTKVEVTFQHSHIDRMPLGDLPSTFLSLAIAHPDVHWIFRYSVQPPDSAELRNFEFDDQPIKDTLGDVPLTDPDVLAYVRGMLEEGIKSTQLVEDQQLFDFKRRR